MKKYTIIALLILLAGIITSSFFLWLFLDKNSPGSEISIKKNNMVNESSEKLSTEPQKGSLNDALPQNESSVDLKKTVSENEEFEQKIPIFIENNTPFVPQAPFSVWDELHEEACEEASIITANGFLSNITEISKETAEKEIQALVDWQMKKYGKHKDLNVKEIQDMAFSFYGDKLEIIDEITEETFKKTLAGKNMIIIPVAGREIGNPNFTPPGPLYHVLVIIGYDESTQEFITNDPGTRKGKGFRYSYQTLLENIHDFPGEKEKILEGKPRALIVGKK